MNENHPNANWLRRYYEAATDALAQETEATRAQLLEEHAQEIVSKLDPAWLVHTAGVQLATVGGLEFAAHYGARLAQLCGGEVQITDVGPVLGDDQFAIARMTMVATRGERSLTWSGMSVWRFEEGIAVEHWEVGPGLPWDAFFLGESTLGDRTAQQFWLDEQRPSA